MVIVNALRPWGCTKPPSIHGRFMVYTWGVIPTTSTSTKRIPILQEPWAPETNWKLVRTNRRSLHSRLWLGNSGGLRWEGFFFFPWEKFSKNDQMNPRQRGVLKFGWDKIKQQPNWTPIDSTNCRYSVVVSNMFFPRLSDEGCSILP